MAILRRTRRTIHTSPPTQRQTRPAPPAPRLGNEGTKIPWRAPGKAVSQETRAFLGGVGGEAGWGGEVEEVEEEGWEGEIRRGMVVEMRR